jgi:hypothetical protein
LGEFFTGLLPSLYLLQTPLYVHSLLSLPQGKGTDIIMTVLLYKFFVCHPIDKNTNKHRLAQLQVSHI